MSRWDKNAWRVLVPVGVVGSLLAAFWLVPFAVDLPYSSSMGYTRVTGLWANILPRGYLWMIVPAGLGMLIAILRRDRVPIVLTVGTLGAVAGFQWLPAGFVYNGRWLPFYFLFTALLAAYGVGEIFRLVGRWLELDAWQAPVAIVLGSFGALIGALVAGGIAFPGFQPSGGQIEVPTWISWNYTGFQGKSGWPVYEGIVRMLDQAGRKYGCGRLQYEYITETNIPFGSTEATMALPYWTDGCMDTIDGVLFESSTTTPFHFLDQAEYSLPGRVLEPGLVSDLSRLQSRGRDQASAGRRRAVLPRRLATGRTGGQERAGARQDSVHAGIPGRDQPGDRGPPGLGPLPDQGRRAARDATRSPSRRRDRRLGQAVARHQSQLVGEREVLA